MRPVLGIFLLVVILGITLWSVKEWSLSYAPFPSTPFPPRRSSMTEARPESELPVAPDPDVPLPLRTGADAAAIQTAWTETGVLDSNGTVGLRVHASVRTPLSTPVHLVAHFFSVDDGAVKSDDPHYRDAVGQAAVASETLPNGTIAEATAFIPLSALQLLGSQEHLKLLPALFDENNQPIATGLHVPFFFDRGSVYITAVHFENLHNGSWQLKYTVQAPQHPNEIYGEAIVQFKDARGAAVPGWPLASNAAGKLMVSGRFNIPAGFGAYTMDAPPILLEPGIALLCPTAEIRLFDSRSGQWLSSTLSFGIAKTPGK
jgi:hypothetical protein